jgi:hypothetical protein
MSSNQPPRRLREWFPLDMVDWEMLSENPTATDLLKDNLDK